MKKFCQKCLFYGFQNHGACPDCGAVLQAKPGTSYLPLTGEMADDFKALSALTGQSAYESMAMAIHLTRLVLETVKPELFSLIQELERKRMAEQILRYKEKNDQ